MSTALTFDTDPMAIAARDEELGIEVLDEMIEEDFWDGFVVGAGIGATAASAAVAVGIAVAT
jgi:hypothetical protein